MLAVCPTCSSMVVLHTASPAGACPAVLSTQIRPTHVLTAAPLCSSLVCRLQMLCMPETCMLRSPETPQSCPKGESSSNMPWPMHSIHAVLRCGKHGAEQEKQIQKTNYPHMLATQPSKLYEGHRDRHRKPSDEGALQLQCSWSQCSAMHCILVPSHRGM